MKFASGKEYYRYIASIKDFAQQLTEKKRGPLEVAMQQVNILNALRTGAACVPS